MDKLLQIFSTREIATGVWMIIFLISIQFNTTVRIACHRVLHALTHKKILLCILFLGLYMGGATLLLLKVKFWSISMFKDTILWFFFSALIILFNIQKAKEPGFFKNLMRGSISVAIFIEYLSNLYTFPLLTELITFPLIAGLIILQSFAEVEHKRDPQPQYQRTSSCLNKALTLIGGIMLIYVIYKTISGYHNLAVADHFRLFLLPVLLTLFSIPYFYGLSLYIEYESLFITIKHTRRNENPVITQKLLIAILLYANISKKRISRIWKYHLTFNPRKDDPFVYIKKVVKEPTYTIGTGAQLPIFNDIGQVLKELSGNGIGALGEWRTFYNNTYCSMTDYFTFGKDYPPRIPNTLVYNLTGEETWIKELSLSLDIGNQQDQQEAILKFRDIVILTFQSLNLTYPKELISAICEEKEWSIEEENYHITLNSQQFELLKNIEFKITTKIY